jgi:outer membrane protein assembly factor BamD
MLRKRFVECDLHRIVATIVGRMMGAHRRADIIAVVRGRSEGIVLSTGQWRRWLLLGAIALMTACGTTDRDPSAKWDAERLYAEAKDEMSAGNWQAARNWLEKLEARYPFGRYAQQAQMEIAYTYYKEGESAQAISAAERFLKLNPNHPAADYVQYLKGLSTFSDDLGLFGRAFGLDPSARDPKAMREAFDSYKELVARYPDSRYAPDARARMNYLVNALAQSEVNVARYYVQRGAYIAAIQRAQGALRTYQGTPASEEALAILVRAYGALGMDELRADSERVLRTNFPGSRYLAAAR